MNRRKFLKAIGASPTVGIAGCGGKKSTPTTWEVRDSNCKVHTSLREGESVGADIYSESWKFTVTSISDETIHVEAEKIIFDEEGQNKEGSTTAFTFERSVEYGELVKFEETVRLAYVGRGENTAHVCVSRYATKSDVDDMTE